MLATLIDTWPDAAKRAFQDQIMIVDGASRSAIHGLRRRINAGDESPCMAASVRPIDRVSLTFAVRRQGGVVAAIQLWRGRDASLDAHLSRLLSVARVRSRKNVVLSAPLALKKDSAAGELIVAVCAQAYRSALSAGARTWLLSSPSELASSFIALGFRDVGAVENDSGNILRALRLDMFDVERLWRIGSPLLAIARQFVSEPAVSETDDTSPHAHGNTIAGVQSCARALRQARVAATSLRVCHRYRPRRRTAMGTIRR